jgi:hypothetical protein
MLPVNQNLSAGNIEANSIDELILTLIEISEIIFFLNQKQ